MPGPGGEEGTQGQSRTLARLMHACTHTLEVHRYTLPSLCPGPAVRTQNRLGFENSVGAQACRPNDLSSRSGDLSRPTRWAGADVWTQTLLEGHFLKSSSPACGGGGRVGSDGGCQLQAPQGPAVPQVPPQTAKPRLPVPSPSPRRLLSSPGGFTSKAVSTISSMTEAWERNFCWYCSTPATSCRKWNRSSCCLAGVGGWAEVEGKAGQAPQPQGPQAALLAYLPVPPITLLISPGLPSVPPFPWPGPAPTIRPQHTQPPTIICPPPVPPTVHPSACLSSYPTLTHAPVPPPARPPTRLANHLLSHRMAPPFPSLTHPSIHLFLPGPAPFARQSSTNPHPHPHGCPFIHSFRASPSYQSTHQATLKSAR